MEATQDNTPAQILVVDDEQGHAEVMAEALRRQGHVCTLVHDLAAAQEELKHGQFDLVVTDLVMDGEQDGLEVLATARQTQPNAETILVTAHGDVPTAKAAIRGGAFDFIEKPLDLDVFRTLCGHALQAVLLRASNTELRQQLDQRYGLEGIVGQGAAIKQVLATITQIAPTDFPVLVTGESGTGKELVARAIHANSRRAKKRFRALNCAGLSESLLESELFGHVKGAFTDASANRVGVFEYADGGTLLLDEIGDMPLSMQAKLLRVLEDGEIVRVGSNEPRHVDVRLISATNRDLEELAGRSAFREDLYYRVRGAHIHLPPLRERRDDIGVLARHFIAQNVQEMKRRPITVDDDAMVVLMRYEWPGNVRELISVVRNMVLVCEEQSIEPRHIPIEIREKTTKDDLSAFKPGSLTGLSLDQIEKQAIRDALRVCHGNREQVAKMLGIGERTLYRKLREYGLK